MQKWSNKLKYAAKAVHGSVLTSSEGVDGSIAASRLPVDSSQGMHGTVWKPRLAGDIAADPSRACAIGGVRGAHTGS